MIPHEKFTYTFMNRINKECSSQDNYFLVIKNNTQIKGEIQMPDNSESVLMTSGNIFDIFKIIKKYDKIFLHNLSFIHPGLMMLLSLLPKKTKKLYWVMWGMDLYSYKNKRRGLKAKIAELIKKILIKRLYGIIFWVKGDYELACKWYKTKAKYFIGGYSEDNSEFLKKQKDFKNTDDFIRVQIGNSASKSNEHIEALVKLKAVDFPNMLVYCPLSYAGTPEYVEQVMCKGKHLFGERFIPITEMMPKDEYIKHLNNIDIGVFNTKRQMGLGNITLLVALGKKVYINDYTTSWDYYKDRGIYIYAFNDIKLNSNESRESFLTLLTDEQKGYNYEKIVEYKAKFKEYWEIIFNS